MTLLIDARVSGTTTGRYIDKLIEYLHKLKPGFKIILLTKPGQVNFLQQLAPNFEVVESSAREFSFAEQIKLLSQIRSFKPDLVHFGMTQQPVLYSGKSITTIHDLTTARFHNPAKNSLVFRLKQIVYKLVIKRAAKKSRKVIVPSEFVKNDLAKFARIDPDKIKVTYEAADKISETAEPIEYLTSKVFITYVGNPHPHKNLGRLISAFALLHESHPDLVLVLAGKKKSLYARYESDIKNREIPNIFFTDYVSESQLRWLYENTRAYVFPSLSEGFGLPGLEAMVHGAPVVASNFTCLPEIYGSAAHYFNPLDTDDMASKIGQVIDDKKLRDELIAKGKMQAGKYSWAKMASQTLQIYEQELSSQ